MLLKNVEFGDDNTMCNIQATCIIRYASDVVMMYLLSMGYIEKHEEQLILDQLKAPKIRVNEQEIKEFDDFASNKKKLEINKKNKETNTMEKVKIG